jgi:sporulation protein YlmC with PRC-barrel domain
MTTKLSRMYGMDIFTDSGKFLGNAQDFIVDVESGEVSRILIEQLPASKDDAKKALRDKSILYANVKSVEDVIVVTKGLAGASARAAAAEAPALE